MGAKDHPAASQPAAPAAARLRQAIGWRKWLYRLLAMTVVPALLLVFVEVLLRLCGYGHAPSFFLPRDNGGAEAFIENQDFGLRFFPTAQTRFPMPLVLPAPKPAGTYRIFILGE